ncbi:hypothetical protein FOZ63_027934 [Perkinsus olseni]|uniref:Uncharacterized protein n=1 Tax=Perkinsus olseni TaxID=32597 RepID=A0A7J6SA74_PEROL|nr:hypothetical protein FOZ63_027934 [Perkinsus olseni]
MIKQAFGIAVLLPSAEAALFGLSVKKPHQQQHPGECLVEASGQGSAIFRYEELENEPSLTVTDLFCKHHMTRGGGTGVTYKEQALNELAPGLDHEENKKLKEKLNENYGPFDKCKVWVQQHFKTAKNRGEIPGGILHSNSKYVAYLCTEAKTKGTESGGDEGAEEEDGDE